MRLRSNKYVTVCVCVCKLSTPAASMLQPVDSMQKRGLAVTVAVL